MNNAKEKAKELVNNVGKIIGKELKNGGFKYNFGMAKHCALIAVEEILHVIDRDMNYQNVYSFYLNVKEEIEKL
jgi:hypothetical protein